MQRTSIQSLDALNLWNCVNESIKIQYSGKKISKFIGIMDLYKRYGVSLQSMALFWHRKAWDSSLRKINS